MSESSVLIKLKLVLNKKKLKPLPLNEKVWFNIHKYVRQFRYSYGTHNRRIEMPNYVHKTVAQLRT